MTFDPIALLKTLVRDEVEFIVIGGAAANAWGSPLATIDLDICYARSTANLEHLAGALRGLNARLRGTDEDAPFLLEAKTLGAGDHFTLVTDLGPLDLLGTPAGTDGYRDLIKNAIEIEIDEVSVRVVSLDDLIRMKKAAGRPKDRIAVENLAALRDELNQ